MDLFHIIEVILVFSLLIIFHEMGHFLACRAMGVGVIRFSVGFGKILWSFKRGRTEYAVSAIPLGGYVKMVGEMTREEFEELEKDKDKDQDDTAGEKPEAEGKKKKRLRLPEETGAEDELIPEGFSEKEAFFAAPVWRRAVIVVAGPFFNVVLCLLLLLGYHLAISPMAPVLGYVDQDSAAAAAGLQAGDRILSIDEQAIGRMGQVYDAVINSGGRELSVEAERDGKTFETTLTPEKVSVPNIFGEEETTYTAGVAEPYLSVIRDASPDMPAAAAGLRAGDRITAVNGEKIRFWPQLTEAILKAGEGPMTLQVERGGETLSFKLTPKMEGEGKDRRPMIGVRRGEDYLEGQRDFGAAVEDGVIHTIYFSKMIIIAIPKLIGGELPAEQIGGPIEIVKQISDSAEEGFDYLVRLTALISVNLAVLNLLPIPVLDGGHLLFLAIEAIQRRPLSLRKRLIASQVGLTLLIALMVFAFYNDLRRYMGGWLEWIFG